MKLLRQLVTIFCILASLAANAAEALNVSASGDPAVGEFRLRYPKMEHLTALQIYHLGNPAVAIDKIIGQFVLLEVVVTIQRQVPLVDIVIPKELAAGSKAPRAAIPAHLISATTLALSCKKDQRLRIEGIIVAEGYGAYTIYLQKLQPIK